MTIVSKNVINVSVKSEFSNTPSDPLLFAANEIANQAEAKILNNSVRMELKKTVAHFRETSVNHPIFSTLSSNKDLIKKVLTSSTAGKLKGAQRSNSRVKSIIGLGPDLSGSASVPFVISSVDNLVKISKGDNSIASRNAFMPDKNRVISSDATLDNLGGEYSNKSDDIQNPNIEFTYGRLR